MTPSLVQAGMNHREHRGHREKNPGFLEVPFLISVFSVFSVVEDSISRLNLESSGSGDLRLNRAEYRQFVGIARGSAAEASYHLLLARDLGYIASDDSDKLREDYGRVGQMLTRLAQSLR